MTLYVYRVDTCDLIEKFSFKAQGYIKNYSFLLSFISCSYIKKLLGRRFEMKIK